jgi:hypothetical protein
MNILRFGVRECRCNYSSLSGDKMPNTCIHGFAEVSFWTNISIGMMNKHFVDHSNFTTFTLGTY